MRGCCTASTELLFFSVSMRAESFSATEPAGRDAPVDTAGVCSDVLWNEYCAAWLSVRIIATIAAALKNGAKRSFMVTRRAFTVSGSSISAIMRSSKSSPSIKAETVLLVCAVGAAVAMCILLTGAGTLGVAAFFLCYLCESIMFPTIFALALRGLGRHTKQASSYLIMCIVGGAVAPLLMGMIADVLSMSVAFAIPLACFIVIAAYAFLMHGVGKHNA